MFINIGVISIFLLITSFIGKRRGIKGKVILFIAATSLLVSGVFPYIKNHLGLQNAFLITLAFIILFSMIARRIEEVKQEQKQEQKSDPAGEATAAPTVTIVETPTVITTPTLVEIPADETRSLPVDTPAELTVNMSVDLPEEKLIDLPADLSMDIPIDIPTDIPTDIMDNINVAAISQVTDETLTEETAQITEEINEDVPVSEVLGEELNEESPVEEPNETHWPEPVKAPLEDLVDLQDMNMDDKPAEENLSEGYDIEQQEMKTANTTDSAWLHVEFENMLRNIQMAKAVGDHRQALAHITQMIVLQPPPELLALAAVEAYRIYQTLGNYQKSRHILELVLYNEDGHINPTLGRELEKKIKYSEILEGVLAKASMAGIPVNHVPRYLKREADGEFRLWLKQINDGGV